ncbi:small acid-soluble spore protein SspI [Gorillibacterium sp. sgz500922]|uniref:small acid-soluble spore protein SspI n=1 Tax=Gorillibacterium sp. sgz500922 TaxID=3446694 RepID=UPI003F66ACC9
MNITLRQAIVMRVKGKSEEELREVIADSVDGDEKALPGLGVLFENIWKNSEPEFQTHMVEHLEKSLT